MAERPVFIPSFKGPTLFREASFDFQWSPGFAPVQKKKNIAALHLAAKSNGLGPLLEISTKSEEKIGRHLSAFNLKIECSLGMIPLENAYQGSKVFEQGGPYTDLYTADPRQAKKDTRIRGSGQVVAFCFEGVEFPVTPKTAFYDWLYFRAVFPHRDWLRRLGRYAGFTDIEFNPTRSINCQARSCAIFCAMMRRGILERANYSPETFVSLVSGGIEDWFEADESSTCEGPDAGKLF